MLKKLLFALCFITSLSQAQNVNFPDANFKAALLSTASNNEDFSSIWAKNNSGDFIAVDANADQQIQITEALAVSELKVESGNINSLAGIEFFSNLKYLNLKGSSVTSVTLTQLSLLEYFGASNNALLVNVNCSGLHNLTRIECSENEILSTISLEGVTGLQYLYCLDNSLASIDVSDCPALQYFECLGNQLTSLNCTANTQLISLSCDGNGITSLLCSNLPHLTNLTFSGNNLTWVDLTGLPLVTELDASGNQLSSLNVSAMPLLTSLICGYNQLTTLDVSNNPQLELLWAGNNQITYANLKNGRNITELALQNNPLQMVCLSEIDQFYFQGMQYVFGQMGYPNVLLSAFCSFGPGGTYNTITGNVKYDAAANGCGPDDNGISYARVSVSNGTMSKSYFTGAAGSYTAYAGEGSYSITCDNEGGLFNVSPGAQPVSFTGGGQSADKSFCISSNIMTEDKQVFLAPLTSAQPGFDAHYQLIYRNMGSAESASGTISLTYDDSVIDFISAVPAPDANVGGILTWNYSSLAAFETRIIQLTVNLNSPAEIPSLNLNDILQYNVNITSTATDANPANNNFYFEQIVTGSFDPNDITCLQGSNVSDELVGTPLYYNINFENTGNAPATFIVIEDTFNPDDYAIQTFRMISASHPVEVKTEGQKATFRFDNINLGPNQKGNVVFKIASSEDLMTGDSVSNKANIFFDYNLPIETNVATTTFQVLGTNDYAANSVDIYPNPTNGIVNINSAFAIQKVELYDIQGRLLQIQEGTSQKLDLSGRAKGIYFVKIANANGVKTEKIVLE